MLKVLKVIERYIWVINLFLLFWLAYFAGGLVNFQLEKKFLLPGGGKEFDLSFSPASSGFNYHPSPGRILDKNLFGTEEKREEFFSEEGEEEEIPPTQLNATLTGIVYFASDSDWNRATIFLADEKKADVYKKGDKLAPGVKIAEILEKKVILVWNNGKKEELLFEFEKETRPKKRPRYVSPYARMSPEERTKKLASYRKALGIDNRIQRVSETYYRIEKSAIEEALGNLNDIVTQARMVPNFTGEGEERTINGFRIFRIKPGSVFEKLGLRNGDVIQKINGVEMDSIERGFELLRQLRFEREFEIEVKRGTREMTLSYEIVE